MVMIVIRVVFCILLIAVSMTCMEYVRIGTDEVRKKQAQIYGLAAAFSAGVLLHYILL